MSRNERQDIPPRAENKEESNSNARQKSGQQGGMKKPANQQQRSNSDSHQSNQDNR